MADKSAKGHGKKDMYPELDQSLQAELKKVDSVLILDNFV